MSKQHTPRPWHFDKCERIIVSKEVRWAVIAQFDDLEGGVREVSYPEFLANGRLMQAAPDLLEALELVMIATNFDDDENHEETGAGHDPESCPLCLARNAIAKAKGE